MLVKVLLVGSISQNDVSFFFFFFSENNEDEFRIPRVRHHLRVQYTSGGHGVKDITQ